MCRIDRDEPCVQPRGLRAADLDALPLGTVVLDREGLEWEHQYSVTYRGNVWRQDVDHAATAAQLAGGSRTPLTLRQP